MDGGSPFLTTNPRTTARERDAALRKQSLRQSWPTVIMIPILIGVLHACAFSLLVKLFLGESFGLSGGHPAPWPGAIAILFVVSFWTNRYLGRFKLAAGWIQALTFGCWLVSYLAWVLLEPAYRDTTVWSHPSQFVQSEAYLIPPLLIAMVVWWSGMSHASNIANLSAEDIRSTVQRDWLILFASILLAALVGGEAGEAAISAARVAVPLQLIASLALVAGAEVEATRRMASQRGSQPPGWGRWIRLVGGLAAGVLVLTLIVLALLSPSALGAVVGGIALVARAIAVVLGYVLLAIVWAVFQIVIAISRLLEWLFGDIFGPIEQPTMTGPPAMNMDPIVREEGEAQQWEYAILLRWAAIVAVVVVAAVILFRVTRKGADTEDEGDVDEQRDSVFSADLARQQLRDLFRRRRREQRPARLDLDRPPKTVRETMVYLETLAARQGVARRDTESSADFTARLRAVWPGAGAPLIDFPHRYDPVRYGETADDPGSPDAEAARQDWARVWEVRKNVPPPPEPDGTPKGQAAGRD
jgi:hypothetical protein